MDENRLHTSVWVELVNGVRREVGFPLATEAEIEAWLSANRDRLAVAVTKAYTDLAQVTGLSLRYMDYFYSCVLSHHHGGTIPHSVPPDHVPGVPFRRDGYYRVMYEPYRSQETGFNWKPVSPPRAFTVAWPNEPCAVLYRDVIDQVTKEVWERFGEKLHWFYRTGYAFGSSNDLDDWQDGPLLFGPGVAGKSPLQVLNLSPNTSVMRTVVPIPIVGLPGDNFWIGFGGGATFDRWRRPRVERDPIIDKEDRKRAARCQRVLEFIAGNPFLSGSLGGRPKKVTPAPGAAYEDYVKDQYRRELSKERDMPSPRRRRQIRKRVLRRAERHFPGVTHDLPQDWYLAVEGEQPWRRK